MRRCNQNIVSPSGMVVTYCMRDYGHNGEHSIHPDHVADRIYILVKPPSVKKCDICGGPYLACECCSTPGFHV